MVGIAELGHVFLGGRGGTARDSQQENADQEPGNEELPKGVTRWFHCWSKNFRYSETSKHGQAFFENSLWPHIRAWGNL